MIDDKQLSGKPTQLANVTKAPSCAIEDDEDGYEVFTDVETRFDSKEAPDDDDEFEEPLCDSISKVTRPKMLQGVIVINSEKYEQTVTAEECM